MPSADQLVPAIAAEIEELARRQREALEALEDVALPDHAASARAELVHIAEHLAGYAARLRELVAPRPAVARSTNLARTIRDAVAANAEALAPHELVVAFADGPVLVAAQRRHIEVVLDHLLRTAVAGLRDGRGTIMIALHDLRDRVQVEISDTGRGVPEGRGFGLAIARAVVRTYGGDLTTTSEPGVGATFRFDLPRATGE